MSGFLIGAVAGGLFGFQAVVTEGWATGLWFVAGIGLPAGVAGALLAMPLGMLRGRAVRNRLARRT